MVNLMSDPLDTYMTAAAVAQLMGVSRTLIAKNCRDGIIPATAWRKHGHTYSIDARAAFKAMGRELPPELKGKKPMAETLTAAGTEARKAAEEGGMTPTAVIRNQQAQIQLRKSAIELQQLQGTLVKKDDVYRALFEFGNLIKSRLLAIPATIVDEVLAADTRTKALRVLDDAIREALDELARAGDIQFTKKGKRTAND